MPNEFVLQWLSEVSSHSQSPDTFAIERPRKRPRYDDYPLSPQRSKPSSSMSSHGGSPSKRLAGDEVTPRPKRTRPQTPGSRSTASRASQKTESSQHSSRISTQGHFKDLELNERGVLVRGLDGLIDHPSTKLASFIEQLEDVMQGRGILPLHTRPDFQNSQNPRFSKIGRKEAVFSASRTALGHVPSQTTVLDLLKTAEECLTNKHDELSWNILVHSRVLALALQPPGSSPFSNFVDFFPCQSASITPTYLPPFSPAKKVDFCICLDTSLASPEVHTAVESVRKRLPEKATNHTGYYPLRKRPIALSIETKKPDQGWETTTLQLSVWQASHWNFLEELNLLARSKSPTHQDIMPVFLPCVIIQGQDWKLAITTREDSQTIFWTDIDIGSTKSVLGIYQLIHSLQFLGKWARDDYWPPLQDLLLSVQHEAA